MVAKVILHRITGPVGNIPGHLCSKCITRDSQRVALEPNLLRFQRGAMFISEFAIRPTIPTAPMGITADAAGNIWFVEHLGNLVCRLDPNTFLIDTFDIPTSNSKPIGIAVGPDGNTDWFAVRCRSEEDTSAL